MECVEQDSDWFFLSKYEYPELIDLYGEDFKKRYIAICNWIQDGSSGSNDENIRNKYGIVKARKVWGQILTTIIETGMPYMLSADRANELSNQKNIGLIHNSNLCVTGDTPILTSNGVYNIKDLQDQDIEVWNGEEWSSTTVRQTNESAEIMTVELDNSIVINCTHYHKFYNSNSEEIQAKDLSLGDLLEPLVFLPILDLKDSGKFEHPYTGGFVSVYPTSYDGENTTLELRFNKFKNVDYRNLKDKYQQ